MGISLLLITGFFTLASGSSLRYHFVNESRNWTEAQRYCREQYDDLATVQNMDDMNQLVASINGSYNDSAWIGLYNIINPWRWSLDDCNSSGATELTYTNWYPGRPLEGQCVWKQNSAYNGPWSDAACDVLQYFICYDGNASAVQPYIEIALFMNFTDAQSYCRQHYTDLASARDVSEDLMIASVQTNHRSYIGLYRTNTLTWSDGSNSTFTYWAAGQPHLYQGTPYCTATSISDSGAWTDHYCTDTRPFVCHSVQTDPVVGLRVALTTWRNLSESEIRDLVSQKIKEQLVSGGLPDIIAVNVTRINKRSP
ncbi:hypothetical protein MHYP_G00062690 [Metynnis hypsauchen]